MPEVAHNDDCPAASDMSMVHHGEPADGTKQRGGERTMLQTKSLVAAALFTVALVGGSSSAAFAGEVTGRPGTPDVPFSGSGVRTGAPAHSQSLCSYNGLNDMNPAQGPIHFIVQTPHNQGSPGDAGHGTCAGGTNFENPR